jgi:ubiquinone/menaquinone biosynthesis C-methylase UbiE
MSDDYWENAYKTGEYKHWEFNYPSPELISLLAANILRRNARVLDVGSGGGTDAIFKGQCGFNVTGIDISVAALKIAEKRGKKIHVAVNWLRGDVLDLPISDGTIDFITDRGLLHLIDDNDRAKYASEFFRVLKKDGQARIRGKSKETAHEQFNPITAESIDKYFSREKFCRGSILAIPLFSVEGSMDGRIVMLRKKK